MNRVIESVRSALKALRQSTLPHRAQSGGVVRAIASRSIWWGYFPVVLVAVISLLISVAVYVQYSSWELKQVQTDFREASQDRILVVQREVKNVLGVVQDIASFFEASETVGRREFRKFVGPALKRQAGIKALEWVPKVAVAEREDFLQRARRSFPPFKITAPDPSGDSVESDPRPVQYPVLYVQPYKENRGRLGIDLGQDPVLEKLLQEAERTQRVQVSESLKLGAGDGTKNGIAVVVPVFNDRDEKDESLPEAPHIRGFAVGLFFIGDIVERALESLRSGGIDLYFHQVGNEGDQPPLYTHLSRLRRGLPANTEPTDPAILYRQEIEVGNQRWRVVCRPVAHRFQRETWQSSILFFGAITISGLLTAYVATLVGRSRRVKREVDERTLQLRSAIQALNREVGERKSAEQELQQLNERLEHHIAYRTAEAERRAQYLEQFAYVTSHDLKAPLRAVSNLAEWIQEDLRDKLDDASREQLALLRDRVRRMHDLIEGLLEYSRVGRTADSEQVVDIREVLEETIDSLSPPRGFKIKIQGEMPVMQVDRLQIGQVFANLISNGIKHHGGGKGRVRISCTTDEEYYRFTVCDDGQGIAPEYHDKIFLMFQTLQPSDFESSTGIGLALVKKIVEEHGGTIELSSKLGEGACFHFSWPRKSSSDAA